MTYNCKANFPISSNFPIMSTLLSDIEILYFGKWRLFYKIVLGFNSCHYQCCCFYRHKKPPCRIQGQSPHGFHGQFCRNHTSLRDFKALIGLILDCWIHSYSSYFYPYIFLYWLKVLNEHKQTWDKSICLSFYQ